MKNKGFTLIEVIASVCLLALLSLIIISNVLEIVKENEEDVLESRKTIIYTQTEMYIKENKNKYPIRVGNVYCLKLKDLIDEGVIKVSLDTINEKKYVKVSIDNNEDYIYDIKDKCTPIPENIEID